MKRLSFLKSWLQTYWPILLSGVFAVYLLWTWRSPESFIQIVIGRGIVLCARAGAALVTMRVAQRMENPESRRSWTFIGVGITLWVLADATIMVTLVLRGSLPGVPGFAELWRLAGFFALLAFSAHYPATPPERFGRFRTSLDLSNLGISVGAFIWFVFIRPVLDVGIGSGVRLFWSAINPVFDAVLLVYVLRLSLLSKHWQEAVAFRLIAVAFGFLTLGDLFRGYRLLQAGTGPVGVQESALVVSSMFVVLANRRRALAEEEVQTAPHTSWMTRHGPRLEALMPVALTYIVVGFTVYDWWLGREIDWVGLVASGLLSLLLVARQGVLGGQFEMRQYAALVNASADMAFICQQDGAIRLANPALQELLAEGSHDLREVNLSELLPSDSDLESILAQAREGGWTGEVMLQRHDGESLPVSLSLRPVHDARKGQLLLAGNAHDLREVREREQALREALEEIDRARSALEDLNAELEGKVAQRTQELENTVADLARLNEELQALDRLKSEFVALVSHELRAPLTNISSGVELILEGDSELGAPSHRTLSLVQSETRRLSQFVETILDLSALEAGRFHLQETAISLQTAAERIQDRLPEELEVERLHIKIEAEIPLVLADGRALESVLFHLIDNALKYAPQGDVVVEAWDGSKGVCVAISDAGPGIPAEEREHVFDLFHRLDTRDAREIYGYGLGLPMVQRLLEAMHGGVQIEESDTGGARVVFWLPRADAEHEMSDVVRSGASAARGRADHE